MPSRTYAESCALAHGLDLVGDRWALLVIRELMFGPRRFTDLQARLAGASSSVLTDRLHQLVASGVATRRRLPAPAASWVYELTAWGRELRPAMLAIARWGRRSPLRDGSRSTTPAAIAMAMLLHFDPARSEGLEAEVDLELDGDRFRATVQDGAMDISAPRDTPAAAVVSADEGALKALIGPRRPASARGWAALGVRIEGDQDSAIALLRSLAA